MIPGGWHVCWRIRRNLEYARPSGKGGLCAASANQLFRLMAHVIYMGTCYLLKCFGLKYFVIVPHNKKCCNIKFCGCVDGGENGVCFAAVSVACNGQQGSKTNTERLKNKNPSRTHMWTDFFLGWHKHNSIVPINNVFLWIAITKTLDWTISEYIWPCVPMVRQQKPNTVKATYRNYLSIVNLCSYFKKADVSKSS